MSACLAPIGGDPDYADAQPLTDAVQDDIDTVAVSRAKLSLLISDIRLCRTPFGRGGRFGERLNLPDLCGNWNRLVEDLEAINAGLAADEAALVQHDGVVRGEAG